MKKITLVKLGGSIITEKSQPYTPRIDKIKRLVKELKTAESPLLLDHGTGSYGHTSATIYGGKKGYLSKLGIAKVCNDVMRINNILMAILIEEDLPAVALHPMSMVLAEGGNVKHHLFEVIEEVLTQGLMPVIHGDVIWDLTWKSTILSGEALFTSIGTYLIGKHFYVDKIIYVGKTNGFLDSQGETVSIINKGNWTDIYQGASYNVENDVTGGMKHKIEQALLMAQKGC